MCNQGLRFSCNCESLSIAFYAARPAPRHRQRRSLSAHLSRRAFESKSEALFAAPPMETARIGREETMKILVPVKRVVDYNVKPRVKADGTGVETQGVKMSMNPFDEIAVEEAVRLKERGAAHEVVVVSIGVPDAQAILRTAMAMGADRAILITMDETPEPLAVAKLLKTIVDREAPGLVIMGKQAIDDDMNATGQILAARLNWPQGTFANTVTVADGAIEVKREVDGGLETVKLALPAVITADLRLNEPRYATMPNIMKARKKPLETIEAASLGVDIAPRLEVIKVEEPPVRQAGIKVGTVAELVSKLRDEAKVL